MHAIRRVSIPALRTLAYVNLGINNAMVLAGTKGMRPEGAAAGSAAATLAYLFPKDEKAISARLDAETAALGTSGRADFMAGVEVGRTAAADVIAMAKADRSGVAWSGTLPGSQTRGQASIHRRVRRSARNLAKCGPSS